MSKTIFFSVGEPSGDQHAARLVESLRHLDPELQFRGFGGPAMVDAGCAIDLELTSHAVVGLVEVLPKLRQFFGFVDDAEAIFAAGEVDAVVLVDFPGFNWHIAKRAKKYGIPVYYYCPPQLWAWGAWRVKKMKASVDHVLAVLPMEHDFFTRHGIPTTLVGHPFFDAVASAPLDQGVMRSLRGSQPGSIVAVLPGSRTHEVHHNWPIMLSAIRRLAKSHPGVRFQVAAYRDKHRQYCAAQLTEADSALPLDFHVGATSEIIDCASCAMMVSGSVSLELMARRTPAVVLYRVGRLFYAFGKCVLRLDSMTLPNLMCDREADTTSTADRQLQRPYAEMVSVGNPAPAVRFLVAETSRMLDDESYRAGKLATLDRLTERYAKPGASDRAAVTICDLLGSVPQQRRRVA